ncbi:MAG: hypothetical protein JWR38_109 [Mucilaginibacter sp.]|nr:hypothetical protein [Mucilaginibacter sp.]
METEGAKLCFCENDYICITNATFSTRGDFTTVECEKSALS